MKSKIKKVIALSVFSLVFTYFNFSICFSHELSSQYSIVRRWNNTQFSTVYYRTQCKLFMRDTQLSSNWKSWLPDVVTRWNDNSDYRVWASIRNDSTTNVTFNSPTTWPSNFSPNAVGVTDGRDSDGSYWTSSLNPYTTKTTLSATIYINKSYDSYCGEDKIRVMIHELGHVMGLGHPQKRLSSGQWVNDTTVSSVMAATVTYIASKPQLHDRTDISLFYK